MVRNQLPAQVVKRRCGGNFLYLLQSIMIDKDQIKLLNICAQSVSNQAIDAHSVNENKKIFHKILL